MFPVPGLCIGQFWYEPDGGPKACRKPAWSTLESRMYPALKRALALLYLLEKTWVTQLDSGLPTHMRIRVKGSVRKAHLASEGCVTDEPELYKA